RTRRVNCAAKPGRSDARALHRPVAAGPVVVFRTGTGPKCVRAVTTMASNPAPAAPAGATPWPALVRTQAALLGQHGLRDAASAFAVQVAQELACSRVVVAW